jgi:hypothetical protein
MTNKNLLAAIATLTETLELLERITARDDTQKGSVTVVADKILKLVRKIKC